MDTSLAQHGFGPVIDSESRILILGSFPSLRSRQEHFFYMHPQNRFWKVLSLVFSEDFSHSSSEGKALLLKKHGVALYDVVESCEITGSSDLTIRHAVPADLLGLLSRSRIQKILLNGSKAGLLFRKFFPDLISLSRILPSTSPANARFRLPQLVSSWEKALREPE